MEKIILPNGARIVTEKNDFIKSVTFGVWVGTGSRHETAKLSGTSHFIEHMLFKGTEKHSCAALSEAFDELGGHSNAYTTKEMTAFYARSLDDKLSTTVDLITEMLLCPAFDETAIESERSVIEEEIGMYDDDPEDLATEKLSEIVYPSSSLGRPILGTRASLRKIGREEMLGYMKEKYVGENIVAAVSGNYDEKEMERLSEILSAFQKGKKNQFKKAVYRPASFVRKRKYEQNHFGVVFPSYDMYDERRFASALLTSILGDGASSRLFRRVREEEGLCYSVYAYSGSTAAEGLCGFYAATSKDTEEKALRACMDEIGRIKKEGVTTNELRRAKEKIRTDLLFGMESTGSRASYLARNELNFGRIPTYDEIIAHYQAVTPDDVKAAAEDIFDPAKLSFAAIGRCENKDYYQRILTE